MKNILLIAFLALGFSLSTAHSSEGVTLITCSPKTTLLTWYFHVNLVRKKFSALASDTDLVYRMTRVNLMGDGSAVSDVAVEYALNEVEVVKELIEDNEYINEFVTNDGAVHLVARGQASIVDVNFPDGSPAAALNAQSKGDWVCTVSRF